MKLENLDDLWSPPPALSISQWAEKYRVLSSESCPTPGKWRNAKVPFAAEIMDSILDPRIDTVVIMAAAQIIKTEVLLNVLGYYLDLDPGPIMVVQPTIDLGESFSKERFSPMIRDTPRLTSLLAPPGAKTSGNTIRKKSFRGGQLVIAGANSAASLASRPIRVLLADEIDRWPVSLGVDGDPLAQAEKRCDAFYNRKKVFASTPTKKGASRIEALAELSDKRVFNVPCPECGEMQPFLWANLVWDKTPSGDHLPETTQYTCRSCEIRIPEKHKTAMLLGGMWKATDTSKGVAGFVGLNGLYSPWSTWPSMVQRWMEAQKLPELLKTFVNLYLGETWEERSEKISEDDLSEMAEGFDKKNILSDTVVFTGGADVQSDRVELTVVGWNSRQNLQVYEHVIFPGSTECEEEAEINPFRDMSEYLQKTYKEKLPMICVDSGYRTAWVHKNIRRHLIGRAVATKGQAGPGTPVVSEVRYAGAHKSPWRMVGVDQLKDALQARISARNGSIRFSRVLSPEFYDQLTAEQVFTVRSKGFPTREWRKVKARNEALDCVVLAWAAAYVLNPDWAILEPVRDALRETEVSSDEPLSLKKGAVKGRLEHSFATGWK